MKAATCRAYGPPENLDVEEISEPWPTAGEILVRVNASTVTPVDVQMRSPQGAGFCSLSSRLSFGVFKPRNPIVGMEFSGRVVAVGARVRRFSPGDAVFGLKAGGASAGYLTLPETGAVAPRPERLSFEEAAAIPYGALTALGFLRDTARLKAGQRILINGATGAAGAFAIQLAKYFGAHVTAVCSRVDTALAAALGADRVIGYQTTDFTHGPERYDVILDLVGGADFSRTRRVLTPDGRHVVVDCSLPLLLQALWTSLRPGPRVVIGRSRESGKDLRLLGELVSSGRIQPVIDRIYGMRDIVEAHRYVETGRQRGAVVLYIGRDPSGNVFKKPDTALCDYALHP